MNNLKVCKISFLQIIKQKIKNNNDLFQNYITNIYTTFFVHFKQQQKKKKQLKQQQKYPFWKEQQLRRLV